MDKIVIYIMIGLAFLILFSIWVICRASSNADKMAEQIRQNEKHTEFEN